MKQCNELFVVCGFHSVAITRSNDSISIGKRDHVAPLKTGLQGCGLSRLPRL